MAAEYLIRLDDACPTMDSARWNAVMETLECRQVRAIIAVVPENGDDALRRSPADSGFWQRARSWARAGHMVAMHGYSHVLRSSAGGLVPVQRFSEFVGLPLDEQRRRVRAGMRVLEANGLAAEAWVAPAHGFDRSTLQALRLESPIRIISDGFTRRPVRRDDFVWLPQQLWRPRPMTEGLWTICLHPNDLDERGLAVLAGFLAARPGAFPDPRDAAGRAVEYRAGDALFSSFYRMALAARRRIRRREKEAE